MAASAYHLIEITTTLNHHFVLVRAECAQCARSRVNICYQRDPKENLIFQIHSLRGKPALSLVAFNCFLFLRGVL
jgi:hypothetical protein